MADFICKFPLCVLKRCSFMGFIFAHLVYKGNFKQIWINIIYLSIRVENFNFRNCFTNHGVPFCI